MPKAVVSLKNVVKKYGRKKVVDTISFEVLEGEVFGILGPNGAGKTTTLEMVEALRPIDGGQIRLHGIDVGSSPDAVKQIIGVQLQSSGFFDRLTLKELLTMFGNLYSQSVDAEKLLADVQLTDKAHSYVHTLSGGQKQRFSIASALVNDPKIVFLDEPTTGLDPQARRNLWQLIKRINKKGMTVVLTTHYMDEAELLCDRVAIMNEGKIIALDAPGKLVTALLKKGFKKPVQVQQANLEDVFIDLTGKELKEA